MANRPKGYGYSRELASKMDAKYSDDDEMEVVAWIQSITEDGPEGPGRENFHAWLKDGQILCKLMNVLEPGSCKPHLPFSGTIEAMRRNKEMENIGMFLKAASEYDLKAIDLFQTVDLYEATNLSQVQTTMFKLSSEAMKKGFDGPQIGVKIADKNIREYDELKTREGRNIIGLQMGTNQVASQQGMTPYGLGRQLTSNRK
ncbi:unnamed protein product [Clavelina lepadiformis]|uniref:Transgelin n=1 Tax=Clavelina lepadiformis TaxID=159417 RepID=A0ABP0FHE1_CLALP